MNKPSLVISRGTLIPRIFARSSSYQIRSSSPEPTFFNTCMCAALAGGIGAQAVTLCVCGVSGRRWLHGEQDNYTWVDSVLIWWNVTKFATSAVLISIFLRANLVVDTATLVESYYVLFLSTSGSVHETHPLIWNTCSVLMRGLGVKFEIVFNT